MGRLGTEVEQRVHPYCNLPLSIVCCKLHYKEEKEEFNSHRKMICGCGVHIWNYGNTGNMICHPCSYRIRLGSYILNYIQLFSVIMMFISS
jgi:hypothetical protein